MGLFGKRKTAKVQIEADIELIEENARAVDVLMVYSKSDAATLEKLTALKDDIKYLSPSCEAEVKAYDKKIADKLGDLKLALNKARQRDMFEQSKQLIEEIELVIAERNSKMN